MGCQSKNNLKIIFERENLRAHTLKGLLGSRKKREKIRETRKLEYLKDWLGLREKIEKIKEHKKLKNLILKD